MQVKNELNKLLEKRNRGILLDVVVFISNVFLLPFMVKHIIALFRQASGGNTQAEFLLGFVFLATLILPLLGASLKRWHYHRRLREQEERLMRLKSVHADDSLAEQEEQLQRKKGFPANSCLTSPIFYFVLNVLISLIVWSIFGPVIFGESGMQSGAIFLPMLFGIAFLVGVQTFYVYRYFSPPKAEPQSQFLRSPHSEILGDLCIFLNMGIFQAFWNMLSFRGVAGPSSITEFLGRIFFLCFIALLVYFPPRIFYLAEDLDRPKARLSMVIANLPIIMRLLIGVR